MHFTDNASILCATGQLLEQGSPEELLAIDDGAFAGMVGALGGAEALRARAASVGHTV